MARSNPVSSLALLAFAIVGIAVASVQSGGSAVSSARPVRAVAADFDGDGFQDLARLGQRHVTLHLSKRQTTLKLHALPDTLGIAAADLDRDGDQDFVSLSLDGWLRFWKNEGDSDFSVWTKAPPAAPPINALSSGTQFHSDLPWAPLAGSVPRAPAARPASASTHASGIARNWPVHLLRQVHPRFAAVVGDCPRPPPAA